MQSIIPRNEKGTCFLCGLVTHTDEHHIFGGHANRKKSEADGLKVYLCRSCHSLVHSDYTYNVQLKQVGQELWQRTYRKTVEDFIDRYGKNYLWEVDE